MGEDGKEEARREERQGVGERRTWWGVRGGRSGGGMCSVGDILTHVPACRVCDINTTPFSLGIIVLHIVNTILIREIGWTNVMQVCCVISCWNSVMLPTSVKGLHVYIALTVACTIHI